MKNITAILLVIFSTVCWAQEKKNDTLAAVNLNEIIVIGKKTPLNLKQPKSLTSVEDYLMGSSKMNMIKRGAYAWEPVSYTHLTLPTIYSV